MFSILLLVCKFRYVIMKRLKRKENTIHMTKFISPRGRFSGELAGIKVEQLKEINYDIKTIEERLKEIKNKLEEVKPFFDEYFYTSDESNKDIQYYKYNPNKQDELSEDINICKYIESYATYLLNSEDLE